MRRVAWKYLLLAGLLAGVCAQLALAALNPIGPTIRVSTTGADGETNRGSTDAKVAFNPAAREYLVVWMSEQVLDQKLEIFGQRLSAAGEPIGANFRISSTGLDSDTTRDAVDPAVVYNPDDSEFLVVWRADALASDEDHEVFAQRVSATATLQGSNFRVSVTGPEGDPARSIQSPAVGYSPHSKEYLVAWTANALTRVGKFEVFAQRLSGAGTPQAGNFRVSHTGTDDDDRSALAPAVAFNPVSAEWLVVFDARGIAAVPSKRDIFGQRLSANGAAVGGDFRISRTAPEESAGATGTGPRLAVDPGTGDYLVAFTAGPGGSEIRAHVVRASGEVGDAIPVSITGPEGDDSRSAQTPQVAFAPLSGEFLVVWEADADTDNEFEIHGQRVTAAGLRQGENFRVSTTGSDGDATRDALGAGLAHDPAGEFLVTYHADALATPNELEVFAQRVQAFQPPPPPPPPPPTPPTSPTPNATPSPTVIAPTAAFGPAATVAAGSRRVSRAGTVTLRLTCAARGLRCAGRVKLATASRVTPSPGKRRRVVTLGSASYSLPPGATRTVRVKLSNSNRRLVRRLRRVRARATANARSGSLAPLKTSRTLSVRR